MIESGKPTSAHRAVVFLSFLLVAPIQNIDAQAPTSRSAGADSVTAAPFPGFAAGGFRRFLLGNTYRDWWTTPIRVGVADLSRIGGGLEAVEREGAVASRPFQFQAANGQVFGFRALVKDATLDWPERQRTSFLKGLAQEQISGTIPAGVFVVSVLEKAAGLISPGIQFVVLPDDPRLGKWRSDFAHQLGVLEHRLRASPEGLREVPGATELVDSDELFKRLRADPASRVDAGAYLAARLVDILVGDWDRHEGQWTWARFDDETGRRWVPIPSDRDWAFNRLDGPVWGLVRFAQHKFQKFDARLDGLGGLMQRAEALDRRILVSLDRVAWDSVVTRFMANVTDASVVQAVSALPPEFDDEATAWLSLTLKQRRGVLPAAAEVFYHKLAGVVEIWATEGPDRITLDEAVEGNLTVTVVRGDNEGRWVRRFVPQETREIRVHTLGGADSIDGAADMGMIRIRIVDAGGGTLSVSPTVGSARIYDSTRRFHPPVKPYSPVEMAHDWGSAMGIAPWLDYKSDVGLLFGGGLVFSQFGFRRDPFVSQLRGRVSYLTGFDSFNSDLTGIFRFENSGRRLEVQATALGADPVRYYGQGNGTERPEPTAFYLVRQQTYRLEPRLVFGTGKAEFSIGGVAQVSQTDEDHATLATLERPYGIGNFTEIGAVAGLEVDTRDDRAYPTRGVRLRLNGRYFPGLGDVAASFGVMDGELTGYGTAKFLPAKPTLALRVGGSHDWGNAPFFEAPALGGRRSIRALPSRRFIGDAAVYGSAELRLDFGGFKLLLPGDWGLYGLADVGRVYLDGESSNRRHAGWGAGLWFAVFERKTTITLTYADGSEKGRVYLYGGFHF